MQFKFDKIKIIINVCLVFVVIASAVKISYSIIGFHVGIVKFLGVLSNIIALITVLASLIILEISYDKIKSQKESRQIRNESSIVFLIIISCIMLFYLIIIFKFV